MHSLYKSALLGTLVALIAAQASAQICKEPNTTAYNQKAVFNCDLRYRNEKIFCKDMESTSTAINGTNPPCPSKPMPMIETPLASYFSSYSAYLWHYPRDEKDPYRPYAGVYSLGTPGDRTRTFQPFGPTAPGTKRLNSCTTQIRLPQDPKTDVEWAALARLQADNCANQYILNAAMYPYQLANSVLLKGEEKVDPAHPEKMYLDADSYCQPLRMSFTDTDEEYAPGDYIKAAWTKMFQDPEYRKTTGTIKCIPRTFDGIPFDHEPHLPCKATIENPLQPPNELEGKPFPEIKLSSIGAVPYEGILDPTHPFSPRWDFLLNDRDYSNLGLATALSPTALGINLLLNVYMDPVKNSVFCAGVKESDETDAQKKADSEVRVDVLTFRKKPFESALRNRTLYNAICYTDAPFPIGGNDWFNGTAEAIFFVWPLSYCSQFDHIEFWGFIPIPYFKGKKCWECFGLNGKANGEDKKAPCATNYLANSKDLNMRGGLLPGGFNKFNRSADCGTKFDKVCRDLRRPYTPINRLKMRYHRPDTDQQDDAGNSYADYNVLTEGALEGTSFKEYFGNHMPYPKVWDLGQSIQKTSSGDKNNQPPTDTEGQYTTIVGVGREGASKLASDAGPTDADGKQAADLYKDQRCKTQGWGPTPLGVPLTFAGVNISLPDPVTSWTETKLYQMNSTRTLGLSCLSRYEKTFKPGGAESMMLQAAGGEFQRTIITKCSRMSNDPKSLDFGRTNVCTEMKMKDYLDAGSPADDNNTIYLKDVVPESVPLNWAGYMNAKDEKERFPSFGGSGGFGGSFDSGLDNAQPGDVIMMPFGPGNSVDRPGLAKLAYVIQTYTNDQCGGAKGSCWVRVLEPDDGKWPDVCGTTDTWGEMKTRYYFKPGQLPADISAEYDRIHANKTCEETKLSHCEQTAWDEFQLWRPALENRPGCKETDVTKCK